MLLRVAIAVAGSLNMDFVVRTARLPAPGETIPGSGFRTIPGGKGANQAFAAARLGAAVRMAGRVGRDTFGEQLRAGLADAGVDVTHVVAAGSAPTGVAMIAVDDTGQNTIVVAGGANLAMDVEDAASMREVFRGARVALFQLETPLAVVGALLAAAKEEGLTTILDPAPARALPASILALADLLTPNETEACVLLGRPAERLSAAQAREAAQALRALGARAVVMKLGEGGSYFWDGVREEACEAFRVEAVDATAAGDTFNAALAVSWEDGLEVEQALRFANAAAAISVTRPGAQPSAPSRGEVERLLAGTWRP